MEQAHAAAIPDVALFTFCDAVYQCRQTGKLSLLGTFTRLHTPRLPTECTSLMCAIVLINGRGSVPVTFRLTTDDELATLWEGTFTAHFPDAGLTRELAFIVPGFMIPQTPALRMIVTSGNTLLVTRGLPVIQC